MTREEIGDEVIDAFLDRIERHPSGCWLWTGLTAGVPDKYEYGYLRFEEPLFTSDGREVVTIRATHVAMILLYGFMDDTLYVCHSCDNPRCVNPEHLFLGEQQDNVDDMLLKGRQVIWNLGRTKFKLNQEEIAKLRHERAYGSTLKELSDRYQLSYNWVLKITRNKVRKNKNLAT